MNGKLANPGLDHARIAQVNVIDHGLPGKRSHAKIPQSKRQRIIALFIVGAVVASCAQLLLISRIGDDRSLPARISVTPHSPIFIVGNDQFLPDNGVRGGSGTVSDPYIISDWSIDATSSIGIYIALTDVHFTIRNVTINCTAQENIGILLAEVSNAWIHNTTIYNCYTGIDIQSNANNIKIDQSSISYSAGHGIIKEFSSGSNINITGNTIFANGGTGISLISTTGFNIADNVVSTNDTSSGGRRGITLFQSNNGVVTGNTVTAIYNEAISCSNSQNVIVGGNWLSSNWYYDLQLMSCSGFLVYHNSFVGTAQDQAFDNGGSVNAWNATYPIGGNYWIGYNGTDKYRGPLQDQSGQPDGIGDTPYSFNVSQIDHYPLMAQPPIEIIPEFPTLLLPVMSVLALLFAISRRPTREEL